MNSYNKLGNLSESIMIKELQKKLYDGKHKEKRSEMKKENSENQVKKGDKGEVKCVFCGSKNNLYKYMGNYYCHKCYRELQNLSADDS